MSMPGALSILCRVKESLTLGGGDSTSTTSGTPGVGASPWSSRNATVSATLDEWKSVCKTLRAYSIKPGLTLAPRDSPLSEPGLGRGRQPQHLGSRPRRGKRPGMEGAHGGTTGRPPFASVSLTQTFARVSMSFSCVGITTVTSIPPQTLSQRSQKGKIQLFLELFQ